MKLATFERAGRTSYGAVGNGGIVDLGLRLGRDAPTLLDLIANGLAGRAREIAEQEKPDFGRDAVTLQRPVPAPGKILCVGVNYLDRNAEYKDGSEQPRYPSVFVRFPASFVAHGAPLVRPPETRQFDYEGEIALVIGKRGRRVPREQAMAHVFGYTIADEGTAREWTRHGKFNVTQGKNFDRSGSIGPWIVTADAMPPGPMRLVTRVNGEVRQNDTTDRLLFPFDVLISYLSTFATLEPGDTILTGTPNGAGARFDPPRWLVPGDVVEVEVEGIGVLSNPVVDEESAAR
jgi:2-keto-4-pentenoate hydratase/2-oxohepta-3-ene-1,7-dioic acid hydratase in catechol pathway